MVLDRRATHSHIYMHVRLHLLRMAAKNSQHMHGSSEALGVLAHLSLLTARPLARHLHSLCTVLGTHVGWTIQVDVVRKASHRKIGVNRRCYSCPSIQHVIIFSSHVTVWQ